MKHEFNFTGSNQGMKTNENEDERGCPYLTWTRTTNMSSSVFMVRGQAGSTQLMSQFGFKKSTGNLKN